MLDARNERWATNLQCLPLCLTSTTRHRGRHHNHDHNNCDRDILRASVMLADVSLSRVCRTKTENCFHSTWPARRAPFPGRPSPLVSNPLTLSHTNEDRPTERRTDRQTDKKNKSSGQALKFPQNYDDHLHKHVHASISLVHRDHRLFLDF